MSPEHTQQPKDHKRPGENTKANRQPSYPHAYRVLAVHVEGLGRPEAQHGEEIGAADEGDDESEGEDPRRLLEARGEHWVFCKLGFVDNEGYEKEEPDEEGYEDVGRLPRVLISGRCVSISLFLSFSLLFLCGDERERKGGKVGTHPPHCSPS